MVQRWGGAVVTRRECEGGAEKTGWRAGGAGYSVQLSARVRKGEVLRRITWNPTEDVWSVS